MNILKGATPSLRGPRHHDMGGGAMLKMGNTFRQRISEWNGVSVSLHHRIEFQDEEMRRRQARQ